MGKMKKKMIIVCALLIVGILLVFTGISNNKEILTTEEIIKKINEEKYEIAFNFYKNTATINGKETKITDLLNISKKKLDSLVENNEIKSFVDNNFIGDINYKDDSIEISNPYSLKSLLVKTADKTVFEDYQNITDITEISSSFYIIKYNAASNTKEDYNKLLNDARIEFVETDILIDEDEDTVSSSHAAWGASAVGLDNYSKKLNYKNNNKIVRVAVVDSGVNVNHEIFKINNTESKIDMNNAYNCSTDTDKKDITPTRGHGTWVSGVIAQSTSNNVKIVPIRRRKALENGEEGTDTTSFNVTMACLSYLMDNTKHDKIDVINMSFGHDELTDVRKEAFDTMLKALYDANIVVVASAGNNAKKLTSTISNSSKETDHYPAASSNSEPYLLVASATDDDNKFASKFSNYGSTIDFAMPGTDLIVPNYNSNTSYSSDHNGTSYSCPFLASAAALVKTEYPSYTVDNIINKLKENTDDLGTTGRDDYYGYGLVNFNNHMFNTPVIANIEIESINWGTSATIKINAIGANKVKSYAVTSTETTPSTWNSLSSSVVNATIQTNATNNGTNYIWVRDALNNISHQSFEIEFWDEVTPIINSFVASDVTNNSFKLQIGATDNESGISKIKWYYKKSNEINYQSVTDSYGTSSLGELGNVTKTHTFKDMESYTNYDVYAEVYDLLDNKLETSIINLKTLPSINVKNTTGGKATVSIGATTSTNDINVINNINIIAITSTSPCFVIASKDNGKTYMRLEASKIDNNKYNFKVDTNIPLEIYVVLVGDINMNGTVNDADSTLIKKSKLSPSNSSYENLSNLEKIVADVDKNGSVTAHDALLIRKSILATTNTNYAGLAW